MAGKLLIFTPDGEVLTQDYNERTPPLKQLQAAVGGYVERVRVKYGKRIVDGFVNEEGKFDTRLSFNQSATQMYAEANGGYALDFIVGNLAIPVPNKKV
jgi:Domain of unknown function (DUF3846)